MGWPDIAITIAYAIAFGVPIGTLLGIAFLNADDEEGRRADYIDDWQWNDNYYDD